MLSLEDDLLDRLDPLVPARLRLGGKSVVPLSGSQLETRFIQGVAARRVLKRHIAFREIGVLKSSTCAM